MTADFHTETLGDFTLQSGAMLAHARVAYKTYGVLNRDGDNAILLFTSFGASHRDFEWMIREGRALDPGRYFIVILNLLGNGLSSSPSNSHASDGRSTYHQATLYDNAMLQSHLVMQVLGIKRVQLVLGWSMGGQLALHWGVLFPDVVERVAAICASARTSAHNHVFLEGVKAALLTDPAWTGACFKAPPERGLTAVGRIYAGWALSQEFYRYETWRELNYASLEDFIASYWETPFLQKDPADILAHIWTWQHADVSANPHFNGDLTAALGTLTARTLLMPCHSDLYFRVEDSVIEMALMPNAELKPISSVWGHRAGNPMRSRTDAEFIDRELKNLLI